MHLPICCPPPDKTRFVVNENSTRIFLSLTRFVDKGQFAGSFFLHENWTIIFFHSLDLLLLTCFVDKPDDFVNFWFMKIQEFLTKPNLLTEWKFHNYIFFIHPICCFSSNLLTKPNFWRTFQPLKSNKRRMYLLILECNSKYYLKFFFQVNNQLCIFWAEFT